MPKFEITAPDGRRFEVTAPDGASQDEVLTYAQKNFAGQGDGAADTPLISNLGQDIGNLAAGAVRGAGSIGATLLAPIDAAARAMGIQNEFIGRTDRREAMDAGLQTMGAEPDSTLYKGGKLAAEIAGTSGVGGALANGLRAAVPGATGLINALTTGGMRAGATPGAMNMLTRIVGGAVTGGASAGLVNPDDAGTGALIGAAMPPALAGVHKIMRAAGRAISIGDTNRPLAQLAVQKYELPLGVGDIAEGGTTRAVRSILNDAPFSGAIGAAQRENVQAGFNKAVGSTFGAPETKLTPDVLDAAKKRMGAEFDRIWNQNSLSVDAPLMNKVLALQQQAAKLPKNEGASLNAEINDLLSKMQPDQSGNLFVPGDVANKFQSYLRRRADGSAGLKNELSDLRQEIISAFNRSVGATDAAALTQNRAQYKAFKTVEPLLNSAEVGVAGRMPGDVPAALLPQAVARQYSSAAGTPLAELSQIGSRFLVDRTPKTGGSMRAALQNTALGTALIGGGLANPWLAASAIPVAAGINGLLGSPLVAKMALNGIPGTRQLGLLGPRVEQMAYRVAPLLSDQ